MDPRPPPRNRTYFSDDGAWSFIVECLEDRTLEVWEVELLHPPGKVAWYFEVPGCPPVGSIYVKLQLLGDQVRGRSFHESCPRDGR